VPRLLQYPGYATDRTTCQSTAAGAGGGGGQCCSKWEETGQKGRVLPTA